MQKLSSWYIISLVNWAKHWLYLITAAWANSSLDTRHEYHLECGVLFLFFWASWSAISLRARSVTKILKDFLFRFFHCLNWSRRFFRSSISWNSCYIQVEMIISTLAVIPSAVNIFQSYCLRKEQKFVGGFPTLRNIVNTLTDCLYALPLYDSQVLSILLLHPL